MSPRSGRRQFLRTALAGATIGVAGCTQGEGGERGRDPTDEVETDGSSTERGQQTTATTTESNTSEPLDSVAIETVASGFNAPLDVVFDPAADRRYVADQDGRIYVHGPDGLRDQPLLDLRDAIEFGGEKGLLGITLHPQFAENRRLFVRYSAPPREGTPGGYSHTFVLAEFEVPADGSQVRRDTERTVLEIPEPQSNHNAGSVAFGPDGYLYVGVGDGGAGDDRGTGHVSDWYDSLPGGNGQDVRENLLGGILRLDVDDQGPDRGYAIPADNPLVDRDGRDEYYAWGFRNPWRLSFDGPNLFVADVGQNQYEEVNLVEKGGNYGWNVKEGFHCFRANDCPDETPSDVRGGEPLRDPILEYPHRGPPVSGISVIGGYVYRGSSIPGLAGTYVFADLAAGGRLFQATGSGTEERWTTSVLPVAGADDRLRRVLSFGRDPDGELYVLGTGAGGGALYKIVPA